jgi:hypothetical protein
LAGEVSHPQSPDVLSLPEGQVEVGSSVCEVASVDDGGELISWAVVVVSAVGFVISTRRSPVPVIEPQMFRSRVFSTANVTVVIAATIFGMQLLGMSLFLQQAWHWSTTDTGLAIAPGPVAIVMSSVVAQKLNEKLPVGLVVASGFGVIAAGQILMSLLVKGGGHSYAADGSDRFSGGG